MSCIMWCLCRNFPAGRPQSSVISRFFSSQAFDGDFVIAAGDTINIWTAPGNFLPHIASPIHHRLARPLLVRNTNYCVTSCNIVAASDRHWQIRPNPAKPGAHGRPRHTTSSGSTRTASPVGSLVCKPVPSLLVGVSPCVPSMHSLAIYDDS